MFTITVLFCWVQFWEFAAEDFLVYYPVTYFVLYVSLLLLAWTDPQMVYATVPRDG